MKKFILAVLTIVFLFGVAHAVSSIDSAYLKASEEAGETTVSLVESIDLIEFQEHFGLVLDEDEEKLVRIALMAYSNGAILEHPAGLNIIERATLEEDPYVGNRNSKKFHYSWCSSVSDIKEKNKVTFHSRDDAVAGGYKPCKRCNP